VIDAHEIVEDNLHHDEFAGMSDDAIVDALHHEGLGTEKNYRDKTEDELKADYQTYLRNCYEQQKADGYAYTDTYDDWLNSYWVDRCMTYEQWLGQATRRTCEE
jgi:hypothetical protein